MEKNKIKLLGTNYRSLIILLIILLVASFLRLYRLGDYITFLGDEGRDAIVWNNMVEKGKFTLLGPTASVGGFYLGPIYYYLALPFYMITNNPVGPAFFVALTGIATVWFIWFISKKWFGTTAAFFASATYTVTALIIRYSRASWNPNPLPFFSLLGLFWASNGIRKKKQWQILGAGVALGIAWQLHYLALILAPVYFSVILGEVLVSKENMSISKKILKLVINLLFLAIGWVIGFSPFLAFEVRHNFPNTKTVLEFITRPAGMVLNFELIGLIRSIARNILRLFITILSWPDIPITRSIVWIITILGTLSAVLKRKMSVLIWFYLGIVIFSLYQGDIKDYYYGFLFPAPFLLFGFAVGLTWKKLTVIRPWLFILLSFFVINQSNRWYLNSKPNRLFEQTENISREIVALSDNRPYNFALITYGNSDHAYRYFLEKIHQPPVPLEQQITDQLLVICEKPEPECQPLGNPIWEIAGFGRAEIIKTKIIPPGITIYKLIHYYGQ